MVKVKTFIHALNLCLTNVKKAKIFLQDKRLTQAEKTILASYFHLRDNELDIVVDKLLPLVSNDPIVESQRKLLLGMAYNNLSLYEKAIPLLEDSLLILKDENLPQQLFNAYHNLFIIELNLKKTDRMAVLLQEMSELKLSTQVEKISLHKCLFCFHSMIGDYAAADGQLKFLDKNMDQMSECQAISILVDKFDYLIKQEKFTAAEKCLNQMKNYRKFHLSENYNFMKNLLAHLTTSSPLWITDSDYQSIPMLFHQIKCIQKLEQDNTEEALEHWNQLNTISSHTYLDNFQYKGDKCLFSLCLDKHQKVKTDAKINLDQIKAESKAELFYKILIEANAPISKENIYQLIYKEKFVEKSDLVKLQRLVSRVRADYNLQIEFQQGCYRIKLKKSA